MPPSEAKDNVIRAALASGRYSVSTNGEIISIARGKPKVLKQSVMSDGYCRVGLCLGGPAVYVKAHRVVAIALKPNPENKPLVNHRDGVKSHNHPDNLEWATEQENSEHAFRCGLSVVGKGEDSPNPKLTRQDVAEIRHLRSSTDLSQREIGEIYGVGQNAVSLIETGRTWA